MTTKKARIQLRRAATQSALESINPVLLAGEPVIALDTGILKIGDGVSTYNQLPEIGASPDLSDYVQKTDVASSSDFGIVKVDGSSITSNNGVISASTSTLTIRRWS